MQQDNAGSVTAGEGPGVPDALYGAALDLLDEPLHVVDQDLRIVLFNRAFARWCGELGLRLGESPLGRELFEAFPFLSSGVRDEYASIFQSGRVLVTEESNCLDGRQVLTETHKVPMLRDGRVRHVVTIVRDVTVRRRTEQSLRDSEERLRAILSSIHETVIVVYEHDGRITSVWNTPEAERRYAMTKAESEGKLISELLPPDEAAMRLEQVQEVFRTGRSSRGEYSLHLPGGEFWLETVLSPMWGDDGQVGAVVAFVRDTTDRKRAERHLHKAQRGLAHARQEERRRLARELHDSVGQSLTALRMRLQSIRRDAGTAGASDLAGALDDLSTECGNVIREVRQISHGLYPATLEQLGLAPALRQMLKACRPAEIECALACPEEVERMRFAEDVEIALFRIGQEAVANALRHGSPGRIEVGLRRVDAKVCLTVCDDGCGFDCDGAIGEGMGLASMHERAESVGGSLEISSRPGRTCVKASVPANPLDA